jgi:hypothetical protein
VLHAFIDSTDAAAVTKRKILLISFFFMMHTPPLSPMLIVPLAKLTHGVPRLFGDWGKSCASRPSTIKPDGWCEKIHIAGDEACNNYRESPSAMQLEPLGERT